MSRGARVLMVSSIILLGLVLFPFQTIHPGYSEMMDALQSTIVIHNNAEFEDVAESMGWPGNGTQENPYIIENLTIQPPSGMNGISISNTTLYFIIRDVNVSGSTEAGVYLQNVSNGVIERSLFEGNYVGIKAYNSSNIVVRDNEFVNNTSIGFRAEGCEDVRVENNRFYEGEVGVLLIRSGNVDVASNYLERNELSIGVKECDGITISQNRMYNYGYEGISIGYYSTNISIVGNDFSVERGRKNENVAYRGIEVWYSNFTLIENNTINGNKSMFHGLRLDRVRNTTIRGNNIAEMDSGGIWIWGGEGVVVEENKILFNGESGIRFEHVNNATIKRNEIAYNYGYVYLFGYHGYGIRMESSNNLVITENLISFNPIGIKIFSGKSNRIYNNSFFYNADTGDKYHHGKIQAYDDSGGNMWYDPSGYGNYWADWARNNDTNDEDGDGIVDWPYKIGWHGYDYYPLKSQPVAWKVEPKSPKKVSIAYGVGYLNISWITPDGNGSSPIQGLRVYRNGEVIAILSPDSTFYNDTSVINGERYEYYLTAFNRERESIRSNTVEGIPGIPGAPLNLTAKGGDGYVFLSWKTPLNIGGSHIIYYKIYRDNYIFPPPCPGGPPSWELVGTVPAIQPYFTDTNVVNGESYIYTVRAVNEYGEGPKSNTAVASPGDAPSPPLNLTARMGDGYVNLTWKWPTYNGSRGLYGYRIYSNGELVGEVGPDELYYNYTLEKPGTYVFYVTAVNYYGESPPSNEVTINYGEEENEVEGNGIQEELSVVIVIALVILVIAAAIWRGRG